MSDQIERAVLQDGDVRITVLSMGCAVQDWQVGDRHVVLGYAEAEDYRVNPASMGVVCGRVVNRISGAAFDLDGVRYGLVANHGPHHLHGGPGGLGWCNWAMERDGDSAVELRLVSEDGDQGFPGRVDFRVRMALENGRLRYEMAGVPDRETPINLAQHIYFNLNGAGDVLDHRVRVDADRYTPNGADLLPLGHVADVDGTQWDFRAPVRLRDALDGGWDGNLVLNGGGVPMAEVEAPSGLRLRLWTDQAGLQVYTSNTLAPSLPAGPGAAHGQFAGLCLEAQGYPNAVNVPAFPSILCSPERPCRQVTSIEIA